MNGIYLESIALSLIILGAVEVLGYFEENHQRFRRQDLLFPDIQNEDQCVPPGGGRGLCRPLSECTAVHNTNIAPRICERRGNNPIICCPHQNTKVTQPTRQQETNSCGQASPDSFSSGVSLGGRRKRQTAEEGVVETQVVGGKEARLNAWPWMVALGKSDNNGVMSWFCGAALISEQYVLSAAHCLSSTPTVVRLSAHNLQGDGAASRALDVDIEDTLRHPRYKYPALYYDIALVRMRSRLRFSPAMRPVCVPTPDQSTLEEQEVILTGWGRTSFFGDTSGVLQEVKMYVLRQSDCYNNYLNSPEASLNFPNSVMDHQLCAGVPGGGKDACQGDSGGPLIYLNPTTQRYTLVGIVSGGVGCGFERYPGIYVRVSSFANWIRENIQP